MKLSWQLALIWFVPAFPLLGADLLATVQGGFQPSPGVATLGHPPVAFDERVWAMKFSVDGGTLFTVTNAIDRIDWRSKRREPVWQPHGGETLSRAVFSPDGTRFARSNQGDQVHVHETATGKLLHTFQGRTPAFHTAAWSPDGARLAFGSDHDVVIHDLATGRPVRRLAAGAFEVSVIEWSPDGRWLALGTEAADRRGSVLLLPLEGEPRPLLLPGGQNAVFSFSPDSTTLAVACEEAAREILYFWDIPQAREIRRLSGHGPNAIVHSPDGRLLATCGLNSLRVFEAGTGREVCHRHADSINDHIWSLAFSPDGKVLATGVENRIRFRDTATWDEIDPDEVLRAPVSALAFTADGRHLISGGWNGDLVLWNWENKTPLWKRFAPPDRWEIRGLSVDPDSRWVGVVQHPRRPETSMIRLVALATGETSQVIEVPAAAGAPPLFHPSRRTAYIATRDHSLVELDCESGRTLGTRPIPFLRKIDSGSHTEIDRLSFDPAGPERIRWSAELRAAGTIHAVTGEESHLIDTGTYLVDADPIPPRSHEHATIGSRIWNLPSLHEATRNENGGDRLAARHPSGLLRFAAAGRRVRVFDILSQEWVASFDLGPGEIQAITLSPDGTMLVAGTTGGLHYLSLEGPPLAAGTSPGELWRLMGGSDHWMAWQAAWALARQPEFIAFVDQHLEPARQASDGELARIRSLLADSSPEVRQAAARHWLDLGFDLDRQTYESLREGALAAKWPAEVPEPLSAFDGFSPHVDRAPIPPLIPLSEHRRAMRAVTLLKASRSDPARRCLERLAAGHPEAPLTKACKTALGY